MGLRGEISILLCIVGAAAELTSSASMASLGLGKRSVSFRGGYRGDGQRKETLRLSRTMRRKWIEKKISFMGQGRLVERGRRFNRFPHREGPRHVRIKPTSWSRGFVQELGYEHTGETD